MIKRFLSLDIDEVGAIQYAVKVINKDAEIIARQQMEIDKLKRQNGALLYSHKALYNVIRETGGKEAFDRFLTTSMELRAEILKMGALSKLD